MIFAIISFQWLGYQFISLLNTDIRLWGVDQIFNFLNVWLGVRRNWIVLSKIKVSCLFWNVAASAQTLRCTWCHRAVFPGPSQHDGSNQRAAAKVCAHPIFVWTNLGSMKLKVKLKVLATWPYHPFHHLFLDVLQVGPDVGQARRLDGQHRER